MNEFADLYIKPGCPWCEDAIKFLDSHGIGYRVHDITSKAALREQMESLSGQAKVPTFVLKGDVLPDFGTDELADFLRSRGVKLEDS